jgi:bifunctional non-homologous end joining protein LigD
MPLARLHAPFDHAGWIYELKYDGFRALAYLSGGRCELMSRKGNVYKSFSTLCDGIADVLNCEAILDGEIVHLDAAGKPQFYDLLRRRSPQHFVAFDLLWLRGRDLRMLPLIERKRRLAELLRRAPGLLVYADYVEGNGTRLFQLACEEDLEGIVAKRKDGLYTPEETSWVKIKNPRYSQTEGWLKLFEKQVQRRHGGISRDSWSVAHAKHYLNT